eukprot:TRINITY_DN710_c0_g2_i1.p2 TRINITY_DN710_c0_g2~~TRINITY_DN710_c0_g2_i1.p2  ORF type:complete len:129 (+),score=20.09 TRINITY_DN710_c0_g2_i1:276-662(+)
MITSCPNRVVALERVDERTSGSGENERSTPIASSAVVAASARDRLCHCRSVSSGVSNGQSPVRVQWNGSGSAVGAVSAASRRASAAQQTALARAQRSAEPCDECVELCTMYALHTMTTRHAERPERPR